jgi:hypothetical protein
MIDWAVMVMAIPTANAARITWNLSESTAGAVKGLAIRSKGTKQCRLVKRLAMEELQFL